MVTHGMKSGFQVITQMSHRKKIGKKKGTVRKITVKHIPMLYKLSTISLMLSLFLSLFI